MLLHPIDYQRIAKADYHKRLIVEKQDNLPCVVVSTTVKNQDCNIGTSKA